MAAVNWGDRAHGLASALLTGLGRDLVVPEPVLVEADRLLRAKVSRGGGGLAPFGHGQRRALPWLPLPGLFRRAVQIDAHFADLDLGLVDSSIMAYAERHDLPILTFDFEDFRAAPPEGGSWRLVVDERRYAEATEG
ncbi:MAG: hypothetical protein M3N51_00155 [Actinomycetota bacterium]|nr:hypothetical protein [Actinomycetota bacterium]